MAKESNFRVQPHRIRAFLNGPERLAFDLFCGRPSNQRIPIMLANDSPIRTVVVDDDPYIWKLICRILQIRFGSSLSLTGTSDVTQAIELARSGQIDLCLTDLEMPDVNGLRLLEAIKSVDVLVQVVIVTSHPMLADIEAAFRLGADDYLLKPIDTDSLCDCVQYMSNRLRRFHRDVYVREPVLTADCDM